MDPSAPFNVLWQHSNEFVNDSETNISFHEMDFAPSVSFLEDHKGGIEPFMRERVAEWLLEMAEYFRCDVDIFSKAMTIFDSFIHKSSVVPDKLQASGAVALLLATKIEQHMPVSADRIARQIDETYSVATLKEIELKMLDALNWNLNVPGPHDFLTLFLANIREPAHVIPEELRTVQRHSQIFIDMCYLDHTIPPYGPRIIAATALQYFLLGAPRFESESPSLQGWSDLDEPSIEQLNYCVGRLDSVSIAMGLRSRLDGEGNTTETTSVPNSPDASTSNLGTPATPTPSNRARSSARRRLNTSTPSEIGSIDGDSGYGDGQPGVDDNSPHIMNRNPKRKSRGQDNAFEALHQAAATNLSEDNDNVVSSLSTKADVTSKTLESHTIASNSTISAPCTPRKRRRLPSRSNTQESITRHDTSTASNPNMPRKSSRKEVSHG